MSKTLLDLFAIGAAGSLGAMVRYGIHQAGVILSADKLPLGTFTSNMLGCLLIGIATGCSYGSLSPRMKLAVGVGFLGSLTTFSTFASETVIAGENNAVPLAVVNVAANVIAGILMVCAGLWIGRRITGQ